MEKEFLYEKLLRLLQDWKWHSNVELSKICGWRFGWHIFNLKQKWYIIEKKGKEKWDKSYVEYFKLLKQEPINIFIVKNWKATRKEIKFNEVDKYLWNTNIPNPFYKESQSWYKVLLNKLFNF